MKTPLIALSALLIATGAQAANRDFTVNYKDLDLSSPKDQKTLERRISSAARDYCGTNVKRTGSNLRANSNHQCYNDARVAAREQMAELVSKAQKGG